MSRVRHNVLGAVAAALVLAATSCGGGVVEGGGGAPSTSADATTPSSTVAQSTATTAPSEEAAVLAAYQGYWDTWLAANDPPDPEHPDIERYYTGAALERAVGAIRDRRDLGRALSLPEGSRYGHVVEVTALTDSAAVVRDCAVDDGWVVDRASGRVLNDSVVTEQLEGHLTQTPVGWKVARVQVLRQWQGVSSCSGS